MIIRAVSDSDSDGDGDGERARVFGGRSHPTFPSTQAGAGAGARRVWIAVCGGIVGLVLADVAALTGLLARSLSRLSVADEFALVPLALSVFFPAAGSVSVVRAAPASALNHWAGLLLVAAWIYSRETAGSTRRGWLWSGAVVAFGHAVSCVYVLSALLESNGDRAKFWAGAKARRPPRAYPEP